MKTFKPHSDKQENFLFSQKKIAILATGIQFGKTLSGVVWLKMLMHKYTDPSHNFIVCSPTYKILAQSTLPPFLEVMDGCGRLDRQNMCFEIKGGGKCWFRTNTDPDSVVGITNVMAILCDEAGLYSRYFWDNIQARSSFKAAPIRVVTSPYSLNWLYQDFIRPYLRGDSFIREICDLYQATSKENPYFPDEEYEQRRRTMEPRRFNMIYGGNFDKADGLVYQCFERELHVVPIQDLPAGTEYYGGIDWGYTDPFVIIIRAITPDGFHFEIFEHYKTNQTITEMKATLNRIRTTLGIKVKRFVADPSRPDYINELCRDGHTVIAANNDIRIGIDKHYELMRSEKYAVFEGRCSHVIDEYEMYHYPEIKDLKPDQTQRDELPVDKDNHTMDCIRYITADTYKLFGAKKNRFSTHSQIEQKNSHSKSVLFDTEIEKLKKKKRRENWTNAI